MSKYIKLFGVALLFLSVVWFPQKASASTVVEGVEFQCVEEYPDTKISEILEADLDGKNPETLAICIEEIATGNKYLLTAWSTPYSSTSFYVFKGDTRLCLYYPNQRTLYKLESTGEYTKIATSQGGFWYMPNINVTGGIRFHVYRKYTTLDVTVILRTLWSPRYPTPTPTLTPTPTIPPVPNVDIEKTGITELFEGVMRIFNIPMQVGNIEFTWWQIFIYIILAGLVLELVFAPSDK